MSDSNTIYFDTKSNMRVQVIEIDDVERYMIVKPLNSYYALRLNFLEGFKPSDYIKKHFIKEQGGENE